MSAAEDFRRLAEMAQAGLDAPSMGTASSAGLVRALRDIRSTAHRLALTTELLDQVVPPARDDALDDLYHQLVAMLCSTGKQLAHGTTEAGGRNAVVRFTDEEVHTFMQNRYGGTRLEAWRDHLQMTTTFRITQGPQHQTRESQ